MFNILSDSDLGPKSTLSPIQKQTQPANSHRSKQRYSTASPTMKKAVIRAKGIFGRSSKNSKGGYESANSSPSAQSPPLSTSASQTPETSKITGPEKKSPTLPVLVESQISPQVLRPNSRSAVKITDVEISMSNTTGDQNAEKHKTALSETSGLIKSVPQLICRAHS
jgi:hypothetical protein